MAEPKLRQIESWFWRSIAGEPGEYQFEPDLVDAIEPSRTLEPAGRLEVYADAYYLRLRGILAEDFPRVAKLLGEEAFDRLARGYLKACPSTEPSARHLGRAMAQFIASFEDMPAWLADLAGLEWARVDAFDAPDDEPLGMARLAEIDPAAWPQLRMFPVRSLLTLNAAWPVHLLWEKDIPGVLEAVRTSIRVWRRADFQVLHAPMDEHEAAAIGRLLTGSTFAEICQVFEDLDEQQASEQAGALLLRWLEDGIIARVEPSG
ncbi:MAG TPA: DNA-binding domain-containing protein [Candidatus Binataceae bacterium]|jgi:hypothetical protein|nr:DNA-binding domain-containing protein [Candidatus Binataceae bacterium]